MSDDREEAMLPCPHSSLPGPHNLRINTNRGFTSVRCGCGASGPGTFSKKDAVIAWNHRLTVSKEDVEYIKTPDFDDLLKRLEDVPRFDLHLDLSGLKIVPRPEGTYFAFHQVKTIVSQWIADQRGKR